MPKPDKNSYGQILKSSSIVGGSQGVRIAITMVQVKILAVLLGPMGIGLVGLYQSAMGIAGTIFGMGIGASGVREVSKAAASGNQLKIARTIATLRRVAVIFGALGMAVVFLFRNAISQVTFGNIDHADAFAILSVTLLFASVTSGQTALVQGMRRIGDLAKLSMLGAFWGLVFGVPVIYFWRQDGIAPYLVAVSVTAILSSWWYARKIPVHKVSSSPMEIIKQARGLISLGMMLMFSGLMSSLVFYLIRVMVVRQFGVEAAGLYHAAAQLSNVYIGFILAAMGMDFYPRLTAAAEDNSGCNRLVNEQAEIGLLMAAPGLLATLTFAPLVLAIFYSSKFSPAYDILQWQILGTFLRVVSWPLGFTLLAKGRGKLYFITQLSANTVHIAFFWAGIHLFGLEGAGIAFFGLYVFYLILMMAVVKKLTGFTWSINVLHFAVVIIPAAFTTHLIPRFLPRAWAMAAGVILTLAMGLYCLWKLHGLVGSPTPGAILARFRNKPGQSRS